MPLVVVVAVQLAGVVAVFACVAGDDLHEAPLGVVAPAVVDLARSDDVLLLPRRASSDQRAAVEAAVRVTSARLGRGVQVELVAALVHERNTNKTPRMRGHKVHCLRGDSLGERN